MARKKGANTKDGVQQTQQSIATPNPSLTPQKPGKVQAKVKSETNFAIEKPGTDALKKLKNALYGNRTLILNSFDHVQKDLMELKSLMNSKKTDSASPFERQLMGLLAQFDNALKLQTKEFKQEISKLKNENKQLLDAVSEMKTEKKQAILEWTKMNQALELQTKHQR